MIAITIKEEVLVETITHLPGLEGRRCVVTGAASGIGDAVARLLIDSGAEVVSLDLQKPSAPVAEHVQCDLSDPAEVRSAAAQIGGLDVLCNVAGVPGTKPAELVIKVNFLGPRLLTETLLPAIRSGGAVVNVASTAGFRFQERLPQLLEWLSTDSFESGLEWYQRNPLHESAPADVGSYGISKEAMTVYTMAAAGRRLGKGVRINAVSPGPVETPILGDFEATMGKPILDWIKDNVGRHARPSDLAPIVGFLASPAAGWVNGFNVIADGGMLAGMVTGTVALPG